MNIEVRGLTKRFGNYGLGIEELSIPEGTVWGLVGNNGAGKTTFLRLLLDLLRADTGKVTIAGVDNTATAAWRSRTGSYLDESFLLDYLSPAEYLEFVGAIYGLRGAALQEAIAPYRAFFPDGLLDSRSRYIRDLSKGNAKKVGIVAAMFVRPALLVLDEPFANLDPGSQIQLKLMLSQLNMTAGTTVVLSSHDLGHVTELCTRIAVLEEGRIVREQSTSDETLQDLELYFATRLG